MILLLGQKPQDSERNVTHSGIEKYHKTDSNSKVSLLNPNDAVNLNNLNPGTLPKKINIQRRRLVLVNLEDL